MRVSNDLPLVAMGSYVVLFQYSPIWITLLTPHRNSFAASLPNMDFLAGRNLAIVHGTLEVLTP